MTGRNERDGIDQNKPERDVTSVMEESLNSEAIPEAGRDAEYNSSTGGAAADEIRALSDTPAPIKRGRDMDH